MNQTRTWLKPFLLLLAIGVSGHAIAAEQTLKATMAWNADGTIYVIGPDSVLFKGDLTGVFYVEKASGDLNAAFAKCPLDMKVSKQDSTTSGTGFCEIIGEGGDSVFASLSCEGKLGVCRGKFKLTGGTGRFKGATGSSDLEIRSVVNSLVLGMGSGSQIAVKSGIAILSKLKYNIPSEK